MCEEWREDVDCLWYESVPKLPILGGDQSDAIDSLIGKVLKGECPTAVEVGFIVRKATEVFTQEPNIIYVDEPVTICGDIHGQFNDLKQIFTFAGFPPYTNYLFLGDYVDRGKYSIEVFMLLCLFKIKYPNNFYVLRGNHESMNVSRIYGFYQELLTKYHTTAVYDLFEPLFQSIPICAVVGKKYFCVHGGISPSCSTLEEISELNRFVEIPVSGPLCDLVWDDPSYDNGDFTESERNVGHKFGSSATDEFLKKNNLLMIIRAHQMVMDGCQYCHHKKVLTVFSAPNYENRSQNKGGYAVVDEDLEIQLVKYTAAPPESDADRLSSIVF